MKVMNKIYSNFLMPSRLKEYEQAIISAKQHGYIHMTVRDYFRSLEDETTPQKVFIHRHDIDSDVSTAKQFFSIEKLYSVTASYYFRLSTLDIPFMVDLNKFGSEASYHYEEIATYAKKHHIKSAKEVLKHMPEIEKLFEQNYLALKRRCGFDLKTVAAHGDFANRKLGVINHEILKNLNLRNRLGIECECYDEKLMKGIDSRVSDRPPPVFYFPYSIFEAMDKGANHIYFLTHPNHWRSNIFCNVKGSFVRLTEQIFW